MKCLDYRSLLYIYKCSIYGYVFISKCLYMGKSIILLLKQGISALKLNLISAVKCILVLIYLKNS